MAAELHIAECPQAADRPLRRLLLLAAALYAAFVIYGSLVPFSFRPMPWAEAKAQFIQCLSRTHYHTSRSDVAVNVLLMAPLAMFLTGAVAYRRSALTAILGAAIAIAACGMLSFGVEFAQMFFPPRTPSRTDIAAQHLGALLGIGVWLLAGRNLVDGLRRWKAADGQANHAAALLPACLLLLVILQTVPFDFATSPVELYRKWRAGAVNLLPFAYPAHSMLDTINAAILNAAQYVPLGMLGRLARSCRPVPRWTHPALLAVGAPLLAEAAQLLVLSRVADLTDVLTGACGVLAGWWAAAVLQWQPSSVAGRWFKPAVWTLLVAVWLGLLALVYWQPLDFHFSRQMIRHKLAGIDLVPLADYQNTTPYNAIDQCAAKLMLFVPLGALLAAACIHRGAGRRPGRACLLPVLGITLAVAVLLEAGQLLLPSRYPGLTDILLGCVGSSAGLGIVCCGSQSPPGTERMTNRTAAAVDTLEPKPAI